MTPETFLDICVHVALGGVLLAIAIGFVRLAKGPSLADRVVALDLMAVLIVAFSGVYAILVADPTFLDVVLVLALIGFLATVALARYAERRVLENGVDTGDRERMND